MISKDQISFRDHNQRRDLSEARISSRKEFFQNIFRIGMTVFCCVGIIVLGVVFLTQANPVTTSIGENISTNDLFVAGNATIGGTMGITGDTAMSGNSSIGGNLDVTGDVTIGGNLNMAGNTSFASINTILYVDGATYSQNSAGIQAAIDALPAEGGKVILPAGTYNITSTVVIAKSNVILEGVGEATKLYLANGVNSHILQVGDGTSSYSGISISNLQIDGNKTNQTWGSYYGIYFRNNITRSRIEKCYVYNGVHTGIFLYYSDNNLVTGNVIRNSGSVGINVNLSHNDVVSNNIVTGSGSTAIYLWSGDYGVVSSNTVNGNGYMGIVAYSSPSSSIVGNAVIDNDSIGILVDRISNGTSVSGNTVRLNGAEGIKINRALDVTVDGNTVRENGNGATKYSGIYIYSDNEGQPANRNVISDNVIYGNGGVGKYQISIEGSIASYVSNNQINGNAINTGATGAGTVNDGGMDTQIAGNRTGASGEALFDITGNSSSSILTVAQNGTGDIINIKDNTNSVFRIADGGSVIMTGNLTTSSINNIIYVDGTTYSQNSAGIQAAIDALPAEGGKIILPKGIYPVNSEITFTKSNVTLEGAGKNTILRLVNGFNADLRMLSDSGHSGLVITGLSIDANQANQTAGNVYGLVLYSTTSDSRIERCWFSGAGTSRTNIESYANHIVISGCTFSGNHSNSTGLHLGGGRDVILSDNVFIGSFYLMYVQNSDNIVVSGNSFYSGDVRLWNSTNCAITGNKFRSSYVYLRSSSNNNTISGNSVNTTGSYGVRIEASSYNSVSSNAIDGATAAGIYLSNASSYNIIDGNNIQTTGTYGVQEAAATEDYNTISGNAISGATASAISALGVHSSIYGNKTGLISEGLFDITTVSGATQTALTVTQNGTGDVVDFKDDGASVFRIDDGGNVVMTGKLTTPNINTILYVDGDTYAQTSAGIQAAIDALPATGGKVVLPAGNYNITTTINIAKSNVTLEGVGEATILYLANGINANVITVGDGLITYSNINIASLKIDGNRANNLATSYGIRYLGANGATIEYPKLEKVFIYNMYDAAVRMTYTNKGIFEHNEIYDNGQSHGEGFLAGDSSNNVFDGNIFHLNADNTIYLMGGGNNVISNNQVVSNGDYCFYIRDTSNVQILNNIVNSCYYGMEIYTSTNIQIIGNTVSGNSSHGIRLYRSSYNLIKDNNFKNNGSGANNTYYDIFITDDGSTFSTYNTIEGNIIRATAANKTKYGIYENAAGDDYNTITGNTIIGPVSGAMSVSGIHDSISGNKTSSVTEGLFDIVANPGATQAALTVTQNGTGNIVDFKDGAISVFKIADGGNVIVSKLNDVAYVDGSKYTQDSAGIQNAIDDLPSTGGKVVLPAATYNVDRAMDAAIAASAGGTVFVDETSGANNGTANDMTLMPASPAINDAYYFGYDYRTRKVTVNLSTQGAGTWNVIWEYWNGTSWTALSGVTDGTTGFTAITGAKDITYTLPTDWVKTAVNSVEKYFIRARLSSFASIATQPRGAQSYGQGSIVIDKSNVALEGVGEASRIYITNNANVSGIDAGNPSVAYSNIRISDLQIDGNLSNNAGGFGGIYFNNVTNSTIDKVYIYRTFRDGIYLYNASDNIISNSYIKNCGSGYGGLELYGSSYVLVTGNHFEGNVYENLSFYGASYLRIIGNNIENANRSGVYLYNVNNSTISGNVIQGNNFNGIWADDTFNYNTIDGNTFLNNGQSANNSYSDIVLSYGTYNIISNNTVRASAANKTKYGIYEASSVNDDYNTIQDNTINGPVSGTVYVQGPHTTVSGNKTSSASEGLFDIVSSAGSASTALTVTQNGTGDIISLKNSSSVLFVVTGAGSVGIGNPAPNASAIVDIVSTTKGVLLPRMTTAQRDAISSPAAGLILYNTETNKLNFYNGSAWETVNSAP